MEKTIFILCLFISSILFAQNVDIKGHISHLKDNSDLVGVNITFIKDRITIFNATSDGKGNYEIKNVPFGLYDIRLNFIDSRDKIIRNYLINQETKNVDFTFPDSCKVADKICPYGHKNNLTSIVYGEPTKGLLKKAKKGKIKLGGCIVSYCYPKWYCKKHKIKF